MGKKKASKETMGDIVFKLSIDTKELDVDLDRVIKKLNKIKRLLGIIDLKKRMKGILSCLKLEKK